MIHNLALENRSSGLSILLTRYLRRYHIFQNSAHLAVNEELPVQAVTKMRAPLRLRSSWQFCCYAICVTALFVTGCCADGTASEGERTSPGIEDPGSQKDGVIYHAKSPPPPRMEDVPPNSTWCNLKLEQGLYWGLVLENDVSYSEVCQVWEWDVQIVAQARPARPHFVKPAALLLLPCVEIFCFSVMKSIVLKCR